MDAATSKINGPGNSEQISSYRIPPCSNEAVQAGSRNYNAHEACDVQDALSPWHAGTCLKNSSEWESADAHKHHET